jgi:carboxylesterase type B
MRTLHPLAALAAIIGHIAPPIKADHITVDTPLGLVYGSNSDPRFSNAAVGVESFLGLKYATVPRRFAKSKLVPEEENVGVIIDATEFGPYCWQMFQGGGEGGEGGEVPYYDYQEQSEECLYLNIWRPGGTSHTSKIPVMVYIHGGGWGLMGSADPPLWGHHIVASDRSVMVISINYRLGIFGFLATDENGSNGMNGIDDQVNALKWINRHVKYFGGDPSRVTIFGQEVGSASVCYLSVNPSAFGLFQRGIMQSGECIVGDSRPDSIGLISGREGYDITLDVLIKLGANSITHLAKRGQFPAQEIATALGVIYPVLDPNVLSDFPS